MHGVLPIAEVGWFSRLLAYMLMAAGAAVVVWMPLTHYTPLAGKRLYGVIFCFMALLVAAVKMSGEADPPRAAAAAAPVVLYPPAGMMHGTAAGGGVEFGPGRKTAAAPVPSPAPKLSPPVKTVTPPAKPTPGRDPELGDIYADGASGYWIRFPTGWIRDTYQNGDPWVAEATDGKNAMLSIGFSPSSNVANEQLRADLILRHLLKQPRTTFVGQGTAVIDGHNCLWFRYTAPLALTSTTQVLTIIHYYMPLRDGRTMEVRLAAVPARFDHLAPLLKKSIGTLHLMGS